MSQEMSKTIALRLPPRHEAITIQVAKDLGSNNRSAAIRFIIEDWLRLRAKADGFELPAGIPAPEEAA